LTRPGAVVGTPGYLAPEQARGRPGDQRSDVFGLGAILCEVLTGAPPFRGSGLLDLLQPARAGDLGEATDRLDRSGADPELVRLAKDCLGAEPAGRPADGSVVAARLADYLAGVQERLRHAEVGQARAETRAEGERTRRRLAVGLAAAFLAVVALGGGTLLLVQAHQAEQTREQGRRQQAAESALARAADLRQQGRWAEALVVVEQARQRLDERDGQVSQDVRRAVADLELVGRLEKIRLRTATWTGRSFAWARADSEYESEFRAAGLGGPDEPAEAVAERIRDLGVRAALVAALDAWAVSTQDPGRRDWARAVAGSADQGDDWSQRLRASWADPLGLEVLAREAPVDRLSPHLLRTLAETLGNQREAVLLLRKAQLQYPGDFWVNYALALRLAGGRRDAEAARFYQAALAARPDTPAVLVDLGLTLKAQDRLDEACDCFRRAIVLDPGFAYAHTNLGAALMGLNKPAEAIACFRKAIEVDPKCARAHTNLGIALGGKGQLAEAIACYRQAIELDLNDALPYYNLGVALSGKGLPAEAIACYRKAIELDPNDAKAHNNLGVALKAQGQVDEAIAFYRKAIELDPNCSEAHASLGIALIARNKLDEGIPHLRRAVELRPNEAENHYDLGNAWIAAKEWDRAIESLRKAIEIDPSHARAHCNLGHALVRRGDLAEALGPFRRGDELGRKRGDWTYNSDVWVRDCERLIEWETQLLDVLAGKSEPADARQRIEMARLCVQTRRYAAAARLSGEAFGAEEKLANNLEAGHRYRAALGAAQAGVGLGRDADKLTPEARAALRGQALDWLYADLAAWRSHNDESQRARVLESWRTDKGLAGVRDEEGLAKLPQGERAAWGELWAEVEKVLKPAR
jgi:eukaryotic-like serine/threonine-protein kinase